MFTKNQSEASTDNLQPARLYTILPVIAAVLLVGDYAWFTNKASDTPEVAAAATTVQPASANTDGSAIPSGEAALECVLDERYAPYPNYKELLNSMDPTVGPADSRVTVIEYFDPNCPHCQALHPIMDAQERFWRNIFGGMASARFHRPSLGLGINQTVEAHLNSAQLFANEFDVFNAEPTVSFLEGREENEAYGMRQADGRYAVLFPASAEVAINRTVEQGEQIKWLNILESNWVFEPINAASLLKLSPPGPGMWVALLDAD